MHLAFKPSDTASRRDVSSNRYLRTFALSFILAVLALSLLACQPQGSDSADRASADGSTDFVISLDWVPNTNHTGLYVALENGYFAQQGLNVKIVQPSEDSASTLVANKRADFGVYFQPNMVKRLTRELPITAVAAIVQHNTSGLMALESLGAQTPTDLNGTRYSTWEDPIDDATVAALVGDDLVKIPGEATDASVALRMNQFDYILAFYGWDGIHAEQQGVETQFFFLKDYEPVFDYYSPVIIANNELLADNPELAKRALAAIKQGYEYAANNPDASAEILLKYAPETNRELAIASQRYLSPLYLDDNGEWGKFDYTRWDRFFDWVYQNELIDEPLAPQAGVSNDYL